MPGKKHKPITKGENVEYLDDYHESDLNPKAEGGGKKRNNNYDEDEEDEGGH